MTQRIPGPCSKWTWRLKIVATVVMVASFTMPQPSSAGTLAIDYGENGQDVQTGFTGQLVTSSSSVITNVTDPFGDGPVKVRISSSANFEGRNRNGLTNTDVNMNNLLDDLVFNAGGQDLVLSIGYDNTVIEAGNYLFTGYFNDSFYNSSNGGVGLSGLGVAAYDGINDGTPDGTTTVSDFRSANPTDPVSTIELTLISDGVNPLLVTLEGTDGLFAFNGFTLTESIIIPEPVSAALFGLGLGLVVMWRRRTRRIR